MVKTKEFINTLLEEFGKEKAKEEFTNDIMERLDSLADKYDKGEVFHLTADEFISYNDDECYGILEFLNELDFTSVEDKLVQEILHYLVGSLENDEDKYPEELLESLFDDLAV